MCVFVVLRRRNITVLVLTAGSFILTIFKLAAGPGFRRRRRRENILLRKVFVDFPGPISYL